MESETGKVAIGINVNIPSTIQEVNESLISQQSPVTNTTARGSATDIGSNPGSDWVKNMLPLKLPQTQDVWIMTLINSSDETLSETTDLIDGKEFPKKAKKGKVSGGNVALVPSGGIYISLI